MSDRIEPVIGLIGGSGLYDIDGLEDREWRKVETPWGEPSDLLLFGRLAEVRRLAMGHVAVLEEKARTLQAMATSLKHLAAHCHGDDRPDCPILEQIAEGPHGPAA